MSEPQEPRPTQLGIYDRPAAEKITSIEIIALVLSALWLLGAVVFFVVLPAPSGADDATSSSEGPLRFMMTMLAIFMPVGMIWVAATAARSSKIMREESQRLQAAIDAIRHAYIVQSHAGRVGSEPSVARKLDEIAAAQRKTESALATFTSTRDPRAKRPAPHPQAEAAQTSLPLGTSAEDMAPAIGREDFIRAINFPETAEDTQGFTALRRALKDRAVSGLVQAAQDVLTLLSQDGIYMDDLTPDMAHPDVWRKFAAGTRGREIAALGGVRDRSSLALTAGRMREDPIFRDAVHHFLRRFDKSFVQFESEASDSEISALAATRSARAFMLLGRVTGVFD